MQIQIKKRIQNPRARTHNKEASVNTNKGEYTYAVSGPRFHRGTKAFRLLASSCREYRL